MPIVSVVSLLRNRYNYDIFGGDSNSGAGAAVGGFSGKRLSTSCNCCRMKEKSSSFLPT